MRSRFRLNLVRVPRVLFVLFVPVALLVVYILPCAFLYRLHGSLHASARSCPAFHYIANSDWAAFLDTRSLEQRLEHAVQEGTRVFVVSHGGTGSWAFINYLSKRHALGSFSATRQGLSYSPRPLAVQGASRKKLRAAVYISTDPLIAICSMTHNKKDRQILSYLSERSSSLVGSLGSVGEMALLDAMYSQFTRWRSDTVATEVGVPVVWMLYEDTLDPACLAKLCVVLGTCITPHQKRGMHLHQNGESLLVNPQQHFQSLTAAEGEVLERETTLSSPCVQRLAERVRKDPSRQAKVDAMRDAEGCLVWKPKA